MLVFGSRLALEMSWELQENLILGSRSGALLKQWAKKFPPEAIEGIIAIAKSFLTNPQELKKGLSQRLFGEN